MTSCSRSGSAASSPQHSPWPSHDDWVSSYAALLFWPVVFPYNWLRGLLRQRAAQQLEQKLGEPRYCDRCQVLHEALTRKSHEAHALRHEWDDLHDNCVECGILFTRWRNGDWEARA